MLNTIIRWFIKLDLSGKEKKMIINKLLENKTTRRTYKTLSLFEKYIYLYSSCTVINMLKEFEGVCLYDALNEPEIIDILDDGILRTLMLRGSMNYRDYEVFKRGETRKEYSFRLGARELNKREIYYVDLICTDFENVFNDDDEPEVTVIQNISLANSKEQAVFSAVKNLTEAYPKKISFIKMISNGFKSTKLA